MELTLLLSVVSTLLLQLFKWAIGKWGYGVTKTLVILLSLGLALIYAVLFQEKIITPHILSWLASIVVLTEGTYKMILSPLVDLLTGQTTTSVKTPTASSGSANG